MDLVAYILVKNPIAFHAIVSSFSNLLTHLSQFQLLILSLFDTCMIAYYQLAKGISGNESIFIYNP